MATNAPLHRHLGLPAFVGWRERQKLPHTCGWRQFLIAALLLCASARETTAAAPPQTQTIWLNSGWNLISIQIGDMGWSVEQVRSALGSSNALQAVWGYEPVARSWQTWQASPASYPSDLTVILPGRGYWVKVAQSTTLTLSGPLWSGPVNLVPGWNLTGFPGLSTENEPQFDLNLVLRGQFASTGPIWTFQGGTAQQFLGYDTGAYPAVTSLKGIQSGSGYWVYSSNSNTLNPVLQVASEADTDVSPLQVEQIFPAGDTNYHGKNYGIYVGQIVRFAGPEDVPYDLNHNGILDSPYTQDTMLFPTGVNQKNLSIANIGSGLMTWFVETPTDSWLFANPPFGVCAGEFDIVTLSVDRSSLEPGYYTNLFTIYGAGTNLTCTVILQVPTVAGDYHGAATVQSVNGTPISLGQVDLNLSLFDDPSLVPNSFGTNGFRGVINRDKALLFPNDVFMDGIFYQGLRFSLTTSFEMPAADRNAPPYTTFDPPNDSRLLGIGNSKQRVDPIGSGFRLPDRDVDGNGQFDNGNLFPFPVRRQVTLQGLRTTADHLEGLYVESIGGALPGDQHIYLEGTFALDRDTLTPTLKSIYNVATNLVTSIGGSAGSAYTNSLTVNSDVQINNLLLTLNLDPNLAANFTVTLYGPGRSNSIVIPGSNLTANAAMTLTNFNHLSGRGTWNLVITWNPTTTTRSQFFGWQMNLQGMATYTASGVVVDEQGRPLGGVMLSLGGGNILRGAVTDADGRFSFPSLTENLYYLTVSTLGRQTTNCNFAITTKNVDLGHIALAQLPFTTPSLTVSPFIGWAPLYVSFAPLVPTHVLAAFGTNAITAVWNFGDGSSFTNAGLALAYHTYTTPGYYTNGLTINGKLAATGRPATISIPPTNVIVEAAQPNTNALPSATNFIFGVGFIGSLASTADTSDPNPADPVSRTIVTNIMGTNYYAVYQESKRDSAAFDIDRFHLTNAPSTFRPAAEDSDFFTQTGTFYHQIHPVIADGVYTTNIYGPYRMICTMGGFVFPPESVPFATNSASVGPFQLQVGRIEN
jgi:hypothetical protein